MHIITIHLYLYLIRGFVNIKKSNNKNGFGWLGQGSIPNRKNELNIIPQRA